MSNQEKPTLAEFQQWEAHPVTKAVMAQLAQEQVSLNQLTNCREVNFQEQKGKVLGLAMALDLNSLKRTVCKKGSEDK